MWSYATRNNLLLAAVDPPTIRSMTVRILLGPLVNLAAVGAALFSVPLAVTMFLSVPLMSLSHRRVDECLRKVESQSGTAD
jgi:hypothetical protein